MDGAEAERMSSLEPQRTRKRRARLAAVTLGIVILALIGFGLVAGPFGRGVVVGAIGGLGLVGAVLVALSRLMAKRVGKGLQPPPLPVAAWDYRMDALDLGGTPVDFARFRGKVLVLNFWATWCAPCVAEMPSLGRLFEKTSDLGVQFACVTREKERDRVRAFAGKHGIGLPIYALAGEPPECFRGRAIPATFVLDPTGVIALRHFGAARWDAESVVAFVRGLAAT
jgi:thiol-disulfide isomerase/thioredoxin